MTLDLIDVLCCQNAATPIAAKLMDTCLICYILYIYIIMLCFKIKNKIDYWLYRCSF